MSRRDPLLPNAWIVARREYRDRTRSRLYLGSTVVLAVMAMLVAIAPIAVRALDRQTVTRIAIVATDAELGQRAVSVADSLLNSPPPGATVATWKKPFFVGSPTRVGRRGPRRRPARRRDARLAATGRPGRHRAPHDRRGRTAPAARS